MLLKPILPKTKVVRVLRVEDEDEDIWGRNLKKRIITKLCPDLICYRREERERETLCPRARVSNWGKDLSSSTRTGRESRVQGPWPAQPWRVPDCQCRCGRQSPLAHEGQSPPKRAGASHASIYPYGPFSTGDGGGGGGGSKGGKIMLGVQNEREWTVLATQVLQRADLTTSPKFRGTAARSENRDELETVIGGIFAQWDADEVTRRLDAAGIANAKVNDMHAVWEHPQLRARGRWRDVDSEVGAIKALLAPGMSPRVEPRMDRIPAVGEHNERILRELGMQR